MCSGLSDAALAAALPAAALAAALAAAALAAAALAAALAAAAIAAAGKPWRPIPGELPALPPACVRSVPCADRGRVPTTSTHARSPPVIVP